jgi:hypothetical protein
MTRRLVCCGAALALACATAGMASAHRTSSFPCRWDYDLYTGLRPGYATGGMSANCFGRAGRLTMTGQWYRLTLVTKKWRLDRSQTRTWSSLGVKHYIEFQERCKPGRLKAVYTWLLRDTEGRVIARNVVKTAPINDPGPGCAYVLR